MKNKKIINKTEMIPVAGIGASAGGLDALQKFFSHVPDDSGFAYIVVVHLSPDRKSILPELIQNVTTLKVAVACDGDQILKNHVYISPPNRELGIIHNTIQLLETVKTGRVHYPIDFFFRSLAVDKKNFCVCIILSGTGSDGSLGLEAVKSNDGLTIVQSEESASYNGMPLSAIKTGVVDIISSPEEMPQRFLQYFNHPAIKQIKSEVHEEDIDTNWMNKIFIIIKNTTGHDFSEYKRNTMVRRISRRMSIQQIDKKDQYIRFLRENPSEVNAIFKELLIGVTSFFRDEEAFVKLKEIISSNVFAPMKNSDICRVWVPGCSTGEEVYTIAILLKECIDTLDKNISVQIFGTDISNESIEIARAGIYPLSIEADITPDRIKKFFLKENNMYRVKKEIRDSVIFSVQNILRDPPFSNLNMLCCRNMLIYFDSSAQSKMMPLFHYTLKDNGVLFLGSSESVGSFSNLFMPLENKWKIFKKRKVSELTLPRVDFPTGGKIFEHSVPFVEKPNIYNKSADLEVITRDIILESYSPAAVVVDPNGVITYIKGRTGKYLETPPGSPTMNIVDMARDGLKIELASALRQSVLSNTEIICKNINVRTNGSVQGINLTARPLVLDNENTNLYIIIFQDAELLDGQAGKKTGKKPVRAVDERIEVLEKELQAVRESNQTIVEELETSNEELKSMNEELQSSNEELQSSNEEHESSKEELQSLNEELQIVNSELQGKNSDLAAIHDDMRNLLNGIEIATIFLDDNLRVKRFTPESDKIINLIPGDIGRPIDQIVTKLKYEYLVDDIRKTIETLLPVEQEIQAKNSSWFKMKIIPYRTSDNRIDGVVLTFTDIEEQKNANIILNELNSDLNSARVLARGIVDTVNEPLLVLDSDLNVITTNTAYLKEYNVNEEKILGSQFKKLNGEMFNRKKLIDKVKGLFKNSGPFKNFILETGVNAPDREKSFISGSLIAGEKTEEPIVLLTISNNNNRIPG